jgi:hypothetical protein
MRVLFLLCFSLSICIPVFGQTYIAHEEEVSGTWNRSGSPYIIEGVAYVPAGKTLTIEPGVVVRFQTGENEDFSDPDFPLGMLRVFGSVVAKGTIKDRILFTHLEEDGEDDRWGAIQMCSNKATSVFSYCILEYARGVVNIYLEESDETVNATGALSFINCKGTVENCVIRHSWAGVNAKGASQVKVRSCNILFNEYGVESNMGAKISIISSILYGNENGFFINEENGVSLSYCFVEKGAWHENVRSVEGNIRNQSDPLFKDVDNDDYRLQKNSPCIKKGEGGKNMGIF